MTYRVITLAAAVLLAGCGSKQDAAEPAKAETAAASAATGPAAGGAPTRDFMVGKWAEDGECDLAIDFKADGSMVGPVDEWELEDGKLTMVGLPQKMHLRVIDDRTMESRVDGTGDPRKLTRC